MWITKNKMLYVLLSLCLVSENEAASPVFLQAITSALSTIPFTGGPMSSGLMGAKLGIGTKLLYYLGYFGRRSKPKARPKATPKSGTAAPAQFGSNQAMPFPYNMYPGGFGGGFGAQGFQQMPYGGMDPNMIYQSLRQQGFDHNTAMQVINQGAGGGFGMNAPGGMPMSNFPSGFPSGPSPMSAATDPPKSSVSDSGKSGEEGEDVESFFNFLTDMDDNSCISRLICDVGGDPNFLGDFSHNIHGIVSNLNVQPTSGAYKYIQIMENGKQGGCSQKFPECSDSSYEVVKSVAPSVGVPENLSAETINKL